MSETKKKTCMNCRREYEPGGDYSGHEVMCPECWGKEGLIFLQETYQTAADLKNAFKDIRQSFKIDKTGLPPKMSRWAEDFEAKVIAEAEAVNPNNEVWTPERLSKLTGILLRAIDRYSKELARSQKEVARLRRQQVGLVWWPGDVINNIQAKPGTAANLAKKAKEAGERALATDFEGWELSGDFGLNKLTLFELRVMGGIFAKMNPGKPGEPITATTWADFWRACGALEADREIWRSDTQHLHKAFTGLLGKTFKTFASRKRYDKKAKKDKYDLQKFEGSLFSYSRVYRDLETGELRKLEEGAITQEEEEQLRPEVRIYPQGLLALAYIKYRRGLPGDLYESIRERLGDGKKVAAYHLKYALHLARHRAEREVIKTNVYALTNELGITWYEKGHRRSEAVKTIEELSAIYLDMGFLSEPVKITGDQVEERLNPERFPHVKQFKEQEAKRLAGGKAKPPRKRRKARKKD